MRNNRGINDGGDLPVEFMENIYNRIVNNEIKMKVGNQHIVLSTSLACNKVEACRPDNGIILPSSL